MQLLPKPERATSSRKLLRAGHSPHSEPLLPTSEFLDCPPPPTLDRGKVAVFIDGSNLFYAASYLGVEIDYTRLLHRLSGNGRFLRAYFYTGVDQGNEKQQGFLLWMRRNGYRVITKDLLQFSDGSKKANLTVEMAIDMLKLANHCDTLVLLSGDGNLTYAVNALSYKGVRIELVSLRTMTSESLINVADCYTDLETLKKDIQKFHPAKRPISVAHPLPWVEP